MSGYKKTKKQYHQMKYLIDTNILIQAKNIHYRMSAFSCIWQWLQETSEVKILDAVFTEILRQDDELKDWVINLHELNPEKFLVSTDIDTQYYYGEVSEHVMANYEAGDARNNFLSPIKADAKLIAKTLALSSDNDKHCIINAETPNRSTSKPSIPNVCKHFGVNYKSFYDVLEDLNASF